MPWVSIARMGGLMRFRARCREVAHERTRQTSSIDRPSPSIRWLGLLITASLGTVLGLLLILGLVLRRRRLRGKQPDKASPFGPRGDAAAALATVEHLPDVAVPEGASATVAAILSAKNYYQVLGLEPAADEAAIRRAKRQLSLATHPDKAVGGARPGSEDAFRLVTEAAEALGDADRRAEYDTQLRLVLEAPAAMEAVAREAGFADAEAMAAAVAQGAVLQECASCGGLHLLRPLPEVDPAAARVCDECPGKARHAVREGEVWLERTRHRWSGDTLRMLCCSEGKIWDMSEMAACEGLFAPGMLKGFPFNSHENPFAK